MSEDFERTTTAAEESPSDEERDIVVVPEDTAENDLTEYEKKLLERVQSRGSGEKYVMPKRNLFQKIDDYWYRNKVNIIIIAAAVLLFGYITITSLPQSVDADAAVYVSYSDYPSTISYEIQTQLEEIVDDTDGNGKHTMTVYDYNLRQGDGFMQAARYEMLMEHLTGEPSTMLWVVDKDLFDMIVEACGEELFESYEGAPLWIEITCNDVVNHSIELGETPRLGFCLRRMDDKFAKNKNLCKSYDNARLLLGRLKEEHPEMFEQKG